MPGCSYKRKRGGAETMNKDPSGIKGFLSKISNAASSLRRKVKESVKSSEGAANSAVQTTERGISQGYHSAQGSVRGAMAGGNCKSGEQSKSRTERGRA